MPAPFWPCCLLSFALGAGPVQLVGQRFHVCLADQVAHGLPARSGGRQVWMWRAVQNKMLLQRGPCRPVPDA